MKRLISALIVVVVMAFCVACGPYKDVAGTYQRSDSSATYTVTLSAKGEFKFERKYRVADPYNPFDNERNNVRKGSFTVENGKIVIIFTYYDEALGKTVEQTATAKITDGKLVITGSLEVAGTYVKK